MEIRLRELILMVEIGVLREGLGPVLMRGLEEGCCERLMRCGVLGSIERPGREGIRVDGGIKT